MLASAHIVRKVDDDEYVALTSFLNLQMISNNVVCKAIGGHFFLQKRAKKSFLARFEFDESDIEKYEKLEFDVNDVHKSGSNIVAIKLSNMKLAEGKEMPVVPEFKSFPTESIDSDD